MKVTVRFVAAAAVTWAACKTRQPPRPPAQPVPPPSRADAGNPAATLARVNQHRAAAAETARRVRQAAFDRGKIAEHQALLAFVKRMRAQLDGAAVRLKGKANAARRIEALQAAQQAALADRTRALQALDPTGDRSRLTGDHDTNLNFLADEYPAAIIGALSGDPHPLAEIRAEMDRHQAAIESWLADLQKAP